MQNTKLSLVILLVVLTFSFAWAKPNPFHTAVAADGGAPSANVSSVAGRAPYFLFFDESGKFGSALKNPFLGTPGAGPKVAVLLNEKGVKVFMAASFGGNMANFMATKGITLKEFSGIAADAAKNATK